ncbi:MAG TPA: glycosyltransferase family 2 protein, partial [Candidatus Sulfotelmatobacter sp.]|nr:glycosyltransferase family 2 protein [Candidatus Sulfotelmatobacter sp.]
GDWIYFLDDDSVPEPGNLRRALTYLGKPEVQMVGGPNLCPPEAPPLEQVFALVLASWLAFGPSRARYAPVGQVRSTSEKELILCNLMARREPLLELGGFNEALYPNEENALMDELQKRGGHLVYDPRFFVHRRPRPSLKAFAKMLMTYGRGRAEQFRLHPTPGSALNFVPPLFCVYLLALVGLPWVGGWLLLPLAFYGLVVLGQAAALIPAGGPFRSLAAMPLIVLTHVLYGVGFWRGLFTRLKPPEQRSPVPVTLERVDK